MKPYRKTAIAVGALFFITIIAGIIESNVVAPILQEPLAQVYPNAGLVKMGALLIFVMSIGIAFISILLFPVLKKHNETIAITYVSFRTIECVLLIVGAIVSLFLVALSKESIAAGVPGAQYYQALSTSALSIRYLSYQVAMVILGLNSLGLCGLLFKSRLIPRWLAVWGFTGYVLLLASALLDIAGVINSLQGTGMLLYLPGGLFELLGFPLWLIVKGFNVPQGESVI